MAITNNLGLASGTVEDGVTPMPLMASDTPAPADKDIAIVVATTAIAQFAPLMLSAGAFVPWVAGSEIAAVSLYILPIGTQRAAVRVAGMFNLDAIAWPGGTTEAQVQSASTGMCHFRKLLYSNKRTGTEGAPGTPAGPA